MTQASHSARGTADWQRVLDFWFCAPTHADYLTQRPEWFDKNAAFDEHIRQEFGEWVQLAVDGGLREWEAQPEGALARVLLLDQFTRNIGRGTPLAFAGDGQALALAQRMVARGDDMKLPPIQRQFIYLPYMHAENHAIQDQCVALYQALVEVEPTLAGALDYAIQHCDIVGRFGRFPHRNAQLGRQTTAEEAEFLRQPGSSF